MSVGLQLVIWDDQTVMINLHFVVKRFNQRIFQFKEIGMGILLLFFFSCKQSENVHLDSLYGKWEIMRAERNGKETSYLRNGYFIINPDGKMTVNITGQDENGTYTLENNKLVMAGDKTFDIQSHNQDSLTVKYISGSNAEFLFYMLKKKEDVQ